jgi:hypothetical protein
MQTKRRQSCTVEYPKEVLIRLLEVSVDDGYSVGIRAGAYDILQAGVHLDQRVRPTSGIEEDSRVTMLRSTVVSRARHQSRRGFTDVGDQPHFHEWNPDGRRQLIQGLHELEPPEELGDEHIVAGLEVGPRHGTSQVPCHPPRPRRLLHRTTEHRTDDVDVEGQSELVLIKVSASERRLAAAGKAVDEDQARHLHTVWPDPIHLGI